MLLQLARSIFEEQTSLESVVHKIMKEAITLLKCERCLVFLLEDHDKSVRAGETRDEGHCGLDKIRRAKLNRRITDEG